MSLTREQAIAFRDQLREARAVALRDGEGFRDLILSVERLGAFLCPGKSGLHDCKEVIAELAAKSPLAESVPKAARSFHAPFPVLYELVRIGRNESAHEGAAARHLTANAIALSLVLEDALVNGRTTVRDYMVPDPVCAHLWEPLSLVRQKMLVNAFSLLPVLTNEDAECPWSFLSDRALARYLRQSDGGRLPHAERRRRLAKELSVALEKDQLQLEPARCVDAETLVHSAALEIDDPILVVASQDRSRLLGIVTAFDLL